MSSQTVATPLALKYRPRRFADLVGQGSVADTLRSAVATGKLKHVYLFSGTRGVGKTSAARIFARAINCLQPRDGEPCNECEACVSIMDQRASDVFEIDAASYTKVDQTRDVLAGVVYRPAALRYKVYIIDEAHMLSKSSFNALLKTLEEPPEHVIFVLATTEPDKIIPTVRSRCQKYHFASPTASDLAATFRGILDAEGIAYEDTAIELIVQEAAGSVRDGVSLVDQVATAAGHLTVADITATLGVVDATGVARLAAALAQRQPQHVVTEMQTFERHGAQAQALGRKLIEHLQAIVRTRIVPGPDGALTPPWASLPLAELFRIVELVFKAYESALRSPLGIARLELALIRIATLAPLDDVLHGRAGPAASPTAAPVAASQAPSAAAPTLAHGPSASAERHTDSRGSQASEFTDVTSFKQRALSDPTVRALVDNFDGSIVAVEDLRGN